MDICSCVGGCGISHGRTADNVALSCQKPAMNSKRFAWCEDCLDDAANNYAKLREAIRSRHGAMEVLAKYDGEIHALVHGVRS